ncbi:MAG: hypothetical protein WA624_15085 [Methylocella sp.]
MTGNSVFTTLTLLAGLRDHNRETGWTDGEENDPTQGKIDAYFLKNVMEEGDREQSGSSSSRLGDPSHYAARRGSRTKFI